MREDASRGEVVTPENPSSGCSVLLVVSGIGVLALIGAWWVYGLFPKPGEQFFLTGHPPERTVVVVASKESAIDLEKFTAAGDNLGLKQLLSSGAVLKVPWGAKVLIIDHDWQHSLYEVRVLDGPFAGKRGWVVRESLEAIPTSPSGARVAPR